jgi:hypothetical protein
MTLELRIQTCLSSGRSHSGAVRQRCTSQVACELGTIRSWAPCTNRTGVLTCLGSQAPGGGVGQVVRADARITHDREPADAQRVGDAGDVGRRCRHVAARVRS